MSKSASLLSCLRNPSNPSSSKSMRPIKALLIILLAGNEFSVEGLQLRSARVQFSPPSSIGAATSTRQYQPLHKPVLKRDPCALFLSSSPEDGTSPKKNPVKKLILVLRNSLLRLKAFPARFAKLSRRAKTLVIIQTMIMTLIFGSVGRKAYTQYQTGGNTPIEVPYSNFLDLCEESGSKGVVVDNLRIGTDSVVYRLTKEATADADAKRIVAYTRKVPASPELLGHLRSNKIPFTALPRPRANTVGLVLRGAILSFYMLILWRMYKTFSGNSGAGDVPGKLASTSTVSSLPSATFNEIQGIDDAKNEVMELVDALRNPEKYAILGARAPTGLLLEGPPGTGKTMLARATAATAGVPLIYCSGSDFVEMFVGRGAARVRKLFERATRMAPCIIFFDELDALGKARDSGSSLMGNRGNDEAEQTLNQLLACMDGLDSNKRICVLAATNRKEVLDSALIRPGRFDRIVTLRLPDANGRENILRVHARKLPGFKEAQGVDEKRPNALGVGEAVDLSAIAALTSGLSGAELEFLVNEAAIRAVRRVSSALREGKSAGITPHVKPEDFEGSLANYFATRKPKGGIVEDVWKNVWRQ
jgi:ATP-dependent Zn protease